MSMRIYNGLPEFITASLLNRYKDTLAVIVPSNRTNEILNPSVETNTTGYTAGAGTLTRVATQQYHGAYSLSYTPTAALTDGFYYGTISTTAGQTRAVQCKFKGAAGVPYKLSVATTGGVDLTVKTFTGTGRWQWIWLFFTETSSTTRRIYFAKNGSTSTAVFYVDGVDSQVCGSSGVFVTTYIDGDQKGYLPNQFPTAYGWTGTPHASTSYRTGQTRAGGRIVRFKDYGFLLTAIIGLGLGTPRNEALGFAQLDGAQYQDTIKPQRSFSLIGRWEGLNPSQMDAGISRLARLLDRDLLGVRQPLTLMLQAQECEADAGELVTIQRAVYSTGLEGNVQEVPAASAEITFEQYLPFVQGRDGGNTLLPGASLAVTNGFYQRLPTGTWGSIGAATGGAINVAVRHPNGLIYVGGNFTDIGGSGADYLASYNPSTSTWAVVGSATALNAVVYTLAIGPDGTLYVGGNFTNASGIANADYIASWNGSAYSALSTGMNAAVWSIAIGATGTVYAAGDFTTAGGGAANRIASWNGAAWAALGTGFGAQVVELAIGPDGILYAAGAFTNGGGVANADYIAAWDGSAWSGLSTGLNNEAYAVIVGKDGLVYVGGIFTQAGGVTANGAAIFNGTSWVQLGGGLVSPGAPDQVDGFSFAPNGMLLIASTGTWNTPGSPTGLVGWNGSVIVTTDIVAANSIGALVLPDDTRYAWGLPSSVMSAGGTAITNNGTMAVSPTITFYGPAAGTVRIYQLENRTTGKVIFFNLTISAGEVVTLTLDPNNLSFISSFQGNVYSAILPGSQTSQWTLQPGAQVVTLLTSTATLTVVIQWPVQYVHLNDALYLAVDS